MLPATTRQQCPSLGVSQRFRGEASETESSTSQPEAEDSLVMPQSCSAGLPSPRSSQCLHIVTARLSCRLHLQSQQPLTVSVFVSQSPSRDCQCPQGLHGSHHSHNLPTLATQASLTQALKRPIWVLRLPCSAVCATRTIQHRASILGVSQDVESLQGDIEQMALGSLARRGGSPEGEVILRPKRSAQLFMLPCTSHQSHGTPQGSLKDIRAARACSICNTWSFWTRWTVADSCWLRELHAGV